MKNALLSLGLLLAISSCKEEETPINTTPNYNVSCDQLHNLVFDGSKSTHNNLDIEVTWGSYYTDFTAKSDTILKAVVMLTYPFVSTCNAPYFKVESKGMSFTQYLNMSKGRDTFYIDIPMQSREKISFYTSGLNSIEKPIQAKCTIN